MDIRATRTGAPDDGGVPLDTVQNADCIEGMASLPEGSVGSAWGAPDTTNIAPMMTSGTSTRTRAPSLGLFVAGVVISPGLRKPGP